MSSILKYYIIYTRIYVYIYKLSLHNNYPALKKSHIAGWGPLKK